MRDGPADSRAAVTQVVERLHKPRDIGGKGGGDDGHLGIGGIAARPRLGLLRRTHLLGLAEGASDSDEDHERDGDRRRGGSGTGILIHEFHALGSENATGGIKHGGRNVNEHRGYNRRADTEHNADGGQQTLGKDHGSRDLLSVGSGLGTGRGGKRNTVGLNEARNGKCAGNGKCHGSEHGHDHDGLVGKRRHVKERLVGKPLGHKAVKGRNGRDGKRANQEADGRGRHTAEQTAHRLHVAGARGIQQRAGAQEELALKHRVVKRVIERSHQGQDGDAGVAERLSADRGAHAQQDDADVLDGVVGQKALDVVFLQGEGNAQD